MRAVLRACIATLSLNCLSSLPCAFNHCPVPSPASAAALFQLAFHLCLSPLPFGIPLRLCLSPVPFSFAFCRCQVEPLLLLCRAALRRQGWSWWKGPGPLTTWMTFCSAGKRSPTTRLCSLLTTPALMSSLVSSTPTLSLYWEMRTMSHCLVRLRFGT